MKKGLLLYCLLWSFQLLIAQNDRGFLPVNVSISGQNTVLYKQSHALIIGNSDYLYWNVLPGVKNDVKKVKTALENNGFNVIVKENLTKMQMIQEIENFLTKYGFDQENRVLIYYAGHGHTMTNNNSQMGYIVPIDAPLPTTNPQGFIQSALPMSNFKTWAESSTFSKHALFIFDACFAGSIFSSRGAPTTNEVINYNTTNPVRQFIASGSANETVPDESVFCTQFVYALSSNDADFNKDGYLTATELGEYLKNTVIQYRKNRQHPQYGKLDNPNFDKGDFVFVLNNQQSSGKTSDQTGNITLISDFTGNVRINNLNGNLVQSGDITAGSSKTFYSLPAQILVISIYSNNQKVWASKVSVDANSTITIKAEATTGSLNLNSYISGNLFINDILRQYVTPGNIVIKDLSVGKHSAKIVTGGQTLWQADFNISAGQTTYLNAQAQTNITFSEPDMILVNGGTFQMGSNDGDEDEKPIMTVTMKNFYISKYEITNKQYCEFLNDYGSNKVKNGQFAGEIMIYPDKYGVQQLLGKWYPASGYENHPVVGVTWYGANEYCNWLSQKTGKKYRLPYESEWEYAAGGGNQNRTKWAGTNDEKKLTEYCWFDKNAHISFWVVPHADVTGTQKVGTKKPNSLGIYDMSGNVWEWCNDNYTTSYLNLFNNNSQNTNIQKVVRGGSWVSNFVSCRVAERSMQNPNYQCNYIGFRVCMSD